MMISSRPIHPFKSPPPDDDHPQPVEVPLHILMFENYPELNTRSGVG